MPQVGFEPMAPVFKRAKRVHALDRAVTVIRITSINTVIHLGYMGCIIFLMCLI
jgi:hypothetical protein